MTWDSKVKEVKDFIDENMLISVHRDELAKKACMSVWSFSRRFKECTGESIKDYIDNLKFNYAKKLLEERKLTIKEISEKLGFSEPRNFYRYFKKRTSKTPSQYMKE